MIVRMEEQVRCLPHQFENQTILIEELTQVRKLLYRVRLNPEGTITPCLYPCLLRKGEVLGVFVPPPFMKLKIRLLSFIINYYYL